MIMNRYRLLFKLYKPPGNPGQLRVFTEFLGKLSQRRVVWSCVQVANLRQEKSANVQGLSQTAGPNRHHQRRAPVARRSNLLPMQARRENIISWIQDWSEYEDFWLCFGSFFALKDVNNCVEIQVEWWQMNFSLQFFKVKCGDDLQFKVPVGWEKVECKTMLYPDFQKKECYCLGDPRLTRYTTFI